MKPSTSFAGSTARIARARRFRPESAAARERVDPVVGVQLGDPREQLVSEIVAGRRRSTARDADLDRRLCLSRM